MEILTQAIWSGCCRCLARRIHGAIGAINVVKLDHYLLKPWDPPDRNLYPVLDDLLDQWSASYRPPFEGIRVIGTRWSPRCYEVREFLARHQIPYQWLDIESAEAK